MSTTPDPSSGESVRYVEASASTPDTNITPSQIRWESSRFSEAALMEVTGKPDGFDDPEPPDTGTEIALSINDTTVGTATVDESRRTGDGEVFVRAFDAVRRLKQATLSREFYEVSVADVATTALLKAGVAGEIAPTFERTAEFLDELKERSPNVAGDAGGAGTDTDTGTDTDSNESNVSGDPLLVRKTYNEAKCANVIAECARRLDGVWYVDETNTVQLRPTPDSEAVDLHSILKFDGGEQAQPYTKVVVVGAQSKNSEGRMLSKESVKATAGDENASSPQTRRFTDKTIRSDRMAQNVANALLKEYEKQAAYGTVELVGDPRPRALDAVSLPRNDHFSGQTFLASAVKHTIDDQGFKTRLQLGGRVGDGGGSGGSSDGTNGGDS